jgi:6-phospho-beta-glucosidase
MSISLAVIGGGSTYTPELVDGFIARADRLEISRIALHDVNAERLGIVGGLAGRMLRRAAWPGDLVLTDDLGEAIDGADFVLLQLRIGGQAARLVDETLPPRFGTIGQETTGAGGFAKALRTVPVVLDIADEARRRAAAGGWIVDFTNPVGIITQALLDEGHRALGLCNVAITLQRSLAERLGVAPDRVSLEHVGLNHLSWIRSVTVDGVDRLPEILARGGSELAREMDLPLESFKRHGVIPSYYLRYYDAFDATLARQSAGHTRASEVMDIEARLLEMYRDPNLDQKPALLADRGGAYYSEAAAQLVEGLTVGADQPQVVDLRNQGALAELADDDVVEVPAAIGTGGAQPLPQRPLPDDMRDLVRAAKRYERLTIKAARSGDRADALAALAANPLVAGHTDPEPLLDALLDANRAMLPAFFPERSATND